MTNNDKDHEYKYSTHDSDLENAITFGSNWNTAEDNEDTWLEDYIAEDAAQDFYDNNDGWECRWPITFYLWDMNNKFIGEFNIDMETEPVFRANKVKS